MPSTGGVLNKQLKSTHPENKEEKYRGKLFQAEAHVVEQKLGGERGQGQVGKSLPAGRDVTLPWQMTWKVGSGQASVGL